MDSLQLILEKYIHEGIITQEEFDKLVEEERKKSPLPKMKEATDKLKSAHQLYDEMIAEENISLLSLQYAKMAQLDEACNISIVKGFNHTLNEVDYLFSCSLSAQANFTGTDLLFKDGFIANAEWSAVNLSTGIVDRVVLSKAEFNTVKLKVFQHINSNISKLRNELQPLIEVATTKEEVISIEW